MIVLDVEIEKAILGRGESPLQGIEYCGGWRDFKGMGIACVCTFDMRTKLSRVFLKDELAELGSYLHGQHTAGFNTRRFDLQLLSEHGVQVNPGATDLMHYDILEQIWVALGLDPDRFVPATHGGWSLDNVCDSTLHEKKSGHGALAPVWWQQGKHGKVIDYCLRDVWLEARLLRYIIDNRHVLRFGDRLDLEPAQHFIEACAHG
jgi:hypothetical protein